MVSRILSVHQLKHKNYVCAFGHFDYLVEKPEERGHDIMSEQQLVCSDDIPRILNTRVMNHVSSHEKSHYVTLTPCL